MSARPAPAKPRPMDHSSAGTDDVLVIGTRSSERMCSGSRLDALRSRGLEWCGVSDVNHPYRVRREKPSFGHVLACVGGEGEVLWEGRWRRCSAGMVFVNPPGAPAAFRARRGARWRFCWVHASFAFLPADQVASMKPRLFQSDPAPLCAAVEGLLIAENIAPDQPGLDQWAELVSLYLHRILQGERSDLRLGRAWEQVRRDPGREWSLEALGGLTHLSREHLRRLCLKETGRSVFQQVTLIRMQRAAKLLTLSDRTVETIAGEVGYKNPFSFSTAFLKWMGVRPSAYRQLHKHEMPPVLMRCGPAARWLCPHGRDTRWRFVELRPRANRGGHFGEGGFFGTGYRLRLLAGPQHFHGVPFDLIEESEASPRSMVMLRSAQPKVLATGGEALPSRVAIPVGGKARALYLLHAAAWVSDAESFAEYRFVFSSGREEVLPVRALWERRAARRGASMDAIIQDWWWGCRPLETAATRSVEVVDLTNAPHLSGRLYVHEWVNPRLDDELLRVEMSAPGWTLSTLALLALTVME